MRFHKSLAHGEQWLLFCPSVFVDAEASTRAGTTSTDVFDPNTRQLLRTRANSLSYDQARKFRDARPAGPPLRPSVEPVIVQRRPLATGVIMIAGQQLS